MKVELPNLIRVTGPNGTQVSIDVSKVRMSTKQKAAFLRLKEAGNPNKVGAADLKVLKSLKAEIQGGNVNTMLICRFDWTWVNID